MLEEIDKGRPSAAHPVPLLFVHGGWHGAWCWDEHFLDFFADKGFRAAAVSLRGHGKSETEQPLNTCSIKDYVDDVLAAVDRLHGSPIVVGHPWAVLKTNTFGSTHDVVRTPRLARAHLFCKQTPQDVVNDCVGRLQPESALAMKQMLSKNRVRPDVVSTSLLVLGAVENGAFNRTEVIATAGAYQTHAQFFPHMGHNMMLEPGWQAVADRIVGWLGERGL